MLQGCAANTKVFIMPVLEECPEPTVPHFNLEPGTGHIGDMIAQDMLMENINLLSTYVLKLKNSNVCYKNNVYRLQKATEQLKK